MGSKTTNNLLRGHRVLLLSILCLFILGVSAQQAVQRGNTRRDTVSTRQNADETRAKQQQKVSQKTRQPRRQQKDERLYLLHADVLKKIPSLPNVQILVGNVAFRQENMYMYCDSAHYYEQSGSFEAFGGVRMNQTDTLKLYGDRLHYDGGTQIAQLRENVRMENRNTTLLTDSLNYDRIYNLGYYFDGGTLMDEQNVLTSEWGEYNPTTKQSIFNYNVRLANPDFTLTSDTLRYNTGTGIADIVGPSEILSDETQILSDNGTYNTRTGKAELYQRSLLINKDKTLTGDSLYYDRNTAVAEAFQNVVLNDTAQKRMLKAHYARFHEKEDYGMATRRALAIDYSQKDSLFMHADTLVLETYYLDTDSMYREMRGLHKVRIFKQDVQGVADSLVYSTVDSCLTLYKDPILWSGDRQILGEQIKAYMNDSTIDWAHVIHQALAVERLDSVMYNQVSGKEMKAFFKNGKIDRTEVEGSVRLVFYPMDKDSTYIGANVSETSMLIAYMKEGKLERMIMKPQTSGTFYPLEQFPADKKYLPTFVWFDYIRPTDPEDVFNWRGKRESDQLKEVKRAPIKLPNQGLFNKKK